MEPIKKYKRVLSEGEEIRAGDLILGYVNGKLKALPAARETHGAKVDQNTIIRREEIELPRGNWRWMTKEDCEIERQGDIWIMIGGVWEEYRGTHANIVAAGNLERCIINPAFPAALFPEGYREVTQKDVAERTKGTFKYYQHRKVLNSECCVASKYMFPASGDPMEMCYFIKLEAKLPEGFRMITKEDIAAGMRGEIAMKNVQGEWKVCTDTAAASTIAAIKPYEVPEGYRWVTNTDRAAKTRGALMYAGRMFAQRWGCKFEHSMYKSADKIERDDWDSKMYIIKPHVPRKIQHSDILEGTLNVRRITGEPIVPMWSHATAVSFPCAVQNLSIEKLAEEYEYFNKERNEWLPCNDMDRD